MSSTDQSKHLLITIAHLGNISYTKPIKQKGDDIMRWVSIIEASKELGIPHIKISRMARRNEIKSEKDPLDSRVRLVDVDELRVLLEKHNQLRGKSSTQNKAIDEPDKEAL